jgi:2-keto-4-pentenoate hydratase/2-oxohepta-3-ene-1,7-dioic acid hydratase in catechol pathway
VILERYTAAGFEALHVLDADRSPVGVWPSLDAWLRGEPALVAGDRPQPLLVPSTPPSAPVIPSKIVCVGLNYRAHAEEMGKPIPDEPLLFLKPSTSVIGPNEPIVLPAQSAEVHFEGELAVVLRTRISRASEVEAERAILGYTILNDVTARDIQRREGQRYTRAKGFDTFAPLGPRIVTGLDPRTLRVQTRVDGELRQDGPCSDLIFPIPTLLSFISHVMTLLPGDVVSTGTPSGVGPMVAGQRVEVTIDGIGTLSNPVAT